MSKRNPRLRVATEHLSEMTNDELVAVAGAAQAQTLPCLTGTETYQCPTLPAKKCVQTLDCLLTGTETSTFAC